MNLTQMHVAHATPLMFSAQKCQGRSPWALAYTPINNMPQEMVVSHRPPNFAIG
jgi:hypothetical protein